MKTKKDQLIPFSSWSLSFLGLLESISNSNSCELVSFDGYLDCNILQQSIDFCVSQNILLRSMVVRKGLKFFWKPSPHCRHQLIKHQISTDNERIIHKYLMEINEKNPLNIYERPPIAFHYIETKKKSYLLVTSSHACSDAHSGAILIKELRESYNRILNKEPNKSKHSRISRGDSPFLSSLSTKEKFLHSARAFRELAQLTLTPGDSLFIPESKRERGTRIVHKYDLGSEQLKKIKKVAKLHNSTVHGLLTVAVASLVEEFNLEQGVKKKKIRMTEVFSARSLSHENTTEEYNNFTVPYFYEVDLANDLCDQLAHKNEQLNRLKSEDQYSQIFLNNIYGKIVSITPKNQLKNLMSIVGKKVLKSNFLLTNPGVLQLTSESFGDIKINDFFNFNATYCSLRLNIIFSTFERSFRVVIVTDDILFSKKELDQFVKALVKSIEYCCDKLELNRNDSIHQINCRKQG